MMVILSVLPFSLPPFPSPNLNNNELKTNPKPESAFNLSPPYYDEKSTRENPKWCVVHVSFRQKFPATITLKELQKYASSGGALENMQVLRQSRLSVSKVTRKEWEFVMSLVEDEDEEEEEGEAEAERQGVALEGTQERDEEVVDPVEAFDPGVSQMILLC